MHTFLTGTRRSPVSSDVIDVQVVGEYLVEVWKATGMDMERVKFVWSSDDITGKVGKRLTKHALVHL